MFDPARGVAIAQAGSRLTNYRYLNSMFGAQWLSTVRYWVHE
jgi:hypothetical protein